MRARAAGPVLVAALALAGCGLTPQGSAFKSAVETRGAQAYDEGLATAEWYVCAAASVGSVQRRYGTDPALRAAWQALCLRTHQEPVFQDPAAMP